MFTELVFVLDRSGSMSGLEKDTIGGFNSMLEKQQKEAGEAVITTVLFDDKYELLHDRINITGMSPMTNKEYYVRGSTALLDAVGISIHKIINVQKNTVKSKQAKKVMFVITTDGMENSSREYTYEQIRNMIECQKEKYDWEILFLGANIDAVAEAKRFGIDANRASNYNPDEAGTALNYEVLNEAITSVRTNKILSDNWKERIEADYAGRKKRR